MDGDTGDRKRARRTTLLQTLLDVLSYLASRDSNFFHSKHPANRSALPLQKSIPPSPIHLLISLPNRATAYR